MRSSAFVVCFVLALSTGALAQDATLASVASGVPQLSTLVAAVSAVPDLLAAATNPNTTVTLFAPTNDAFAALLAAQNITAAALLNDTTTLTAILSYHIVTMPYMKANLTNGQVLPTLNGQTLTVSIDNSTGTVTIIGADSNATVITADIPAGMSYVHVIDNVLIPAGLPGDTGAASMPAGAAAGGATMPVGGAGPMGGAAGAGPVTTGPATTGPVTTGPATTGPAAASGTVYYYKPVYYVPKSKKYYGFSESKYYG